MGKGKKQMPSMGMLSTEGNSGNAAFAFILKVVVFILVLLVLFELGFT